MPIEPEIKRTIAFFDGQNLFHAAKTVFGARYPDFDPVRLATRVCDLRGWGLTQVRFYTGIPARWADPFWHTFWVGKLANLGRRGVSVCSRELHYHSESVVLADGSAVDIPIGREKGIDVRLALDVVRLALADAYDVALIFSQDQDLAEAAVDVRDISQTAGRWIRVACAFPSGQSSRGRRGIDNTEWIRIDAGTYAAAIDPRDYRP